MKFLLPYIRRTAEANARFFRGGSSNLNQDGKFLILLTLAFAITLNSASADNSPYSFPLAPKDLKTVRSDLAKDLKNLKKYTHWCISNPKLAQTRAQCDPDGDKISTQYEKKKLKTLATYPDTDSDGRSDRDELMHGTNPLIAENDGGCYPKLFYAKKKVTNKFGIPAGIVGSIPRGTVLFKKICAASSCELSAIKGLHLDFPTLKTTLSSPPINLKLSGPKPDLTNTQIADLVAWLNQDKINEGSCPGSPNDPNNPNNPSNPSGPGCSNPFTVSGDTTDFGIPAGLTGNRYSGADFFSKNNCTFCHKGKVEYGIDLKYADFVSRYEAIPVMRKLTAAEYADLVANANRASDKTTCVATPTPTPAPPGYKTPTPTPAITPTPPPTPTALSCSNQYFDVSGTTTASYASQLKIPSPPGTGNLGAGTTLFNAKCLGCHTGGLPASSLHTDFLTIKSAVAVGVSKGMPTVPLTDTEWSNLVALANIDHAPTNCGGATPTPTPTLSAYKWGKIYSETVCLPCHSLKFQKENRSASKIASAIQEKTQMKGLLPTDTTAPFKTRTQKINELVFYLNCLVSGGANCS